MKSQSTYLQPCQRPSDINRTLTRQRWLLVLLVFCASCAQSPRPPAQVLRARELYTATVAELTRARLAGTLADDEAAIAESARASAAAALEEMEHAATEGDADGFAEARRRFEEQRAVLLKLLPAAQSEAP